MQHDRKFPFLNALRDQFVNPAFIRFILIGGVNTIFSYAVYAILLSFTSYQIAYTIAYILGIVLSYYLNSRFTFRAKMAPIKAIRYPLIYIVQYLLSLLLLYIFIDSFGVNKLLANAITI